jgi:2-amino-4-hydroxy-6-hydroxymethyldihydropteridine diphosphokinase
MGELALIGLGSNLGDRRAYLDRAVASLRATPGLSVIKVSSYHETAPAGGPSGQGAFLNAVVRLVSGLGPLDLLRRLHEIEADSGRVREVRWGERPLDLDLLAYGQLRMNGPDLILPHPRMAVRRFVLVPLAEVAPGFIDSESELSIAETLAILDRRPGFVALDLPPGTVRDDVFRRVVESLPAMGIAENDLARGADTSWIESVEEQTCIELDPLFSRKIAGLARGPLEEQAEETGWIVSDYYLSNDAVRKMPLTSTDPASSREPPFRKIIRLRFEIFRRILAPSIVVSTNPLGGERVREKGVIRLAVESIDAAGITDEILAACEASRP